MLSGLYMESGNRHQVHKHFVPVLKACLAPTVLRRSLIGSLATAKTVKGAIYSFMVHLDTNPDAEEMPGRNVLRSHLLETVGEIAYL